MLQLLKMRITLEKQENIYLVISYNTVKLFLFPSLFCVAGETNHSGILCAQIILLCIKF